MSSYVDMQKALAALSLKPVGGQKADLSNLLFAPSVSPITAPRAGANDFINMVNSFQPTQIDTSGIISANDILSKLAPYDPIKFKALDLPAIKKEDEGTGGWETLFNVLNGTLGQVGGAVRTAVGDTVDKVKEDVKSDDAWWKKAFHIIDDVNPFNVAADTIIKGATNGAKEQWKDWTDPNISWGDVPGVGFLHGAAEGWDSGETLNQKIGVNHLIEKAGGGDISKMIAGLGTEIVSDPLTYLGGAGIAAKAGKIAELEKISELAKGAGLTTKYKNATNFLTDINKLHTGEAAKAREAAQLTTAKAIAKSMKIDPDTVAHPTDLMKYVRDAATKKFPKQPQAVQQTVDKVYEQVQGAGRMFDEAAKVKTQKIADAIDAARAEAFNKNLNTWGLEMPFSKTKGVAIGNVPEKILGVKNPLFRTEATVNASAATHLMDTILDVAGGDKVKASQLKTAILQFAKQKFGADKVEDLTKTQMDFIMDKLGEFRNPLSKNLPDANVVSSVVKEKMPQEMFDKLMTDVVHGKVPWKDARQQLDQIISQVGTDPKLRASIGSHLAQMVSDFWRNKSPKNFSKIPNQMKADSMQWVSNFLKGTDEMDVVKTAIKTDAKGNKELFTAKKPNPKHTDMSTTNNSKRFYKDLSKLSESEYTRTNNAKTAFGHFIDGKWNKFNPRSLATPDKFLNAMAEHIADANSQRVGLKAQYGKALESIEKFMKEHNFDESNMLNTIYHLEGQAPKSFGANWKASAEEQELANMIKPVLDQLKKQEMDAGTLKEAREGYFPHVVNKDYTPEQLKDMEDFRARHPELFGQSSKNKFNKKRTSFDTMAKRDDYLEELADKIKNEKDPIVRETLEADYEKTRDLFETDINKAMAERIREGVRAMSMKELHTNLRKFGMLKTNVDPTKTKGLIQMEDDVARRLGLPTKDENGRSIKHFIQPDVLDGMKRVDEIFTAEGMKKIVRHVDAITDIFRLTVTTFKASHYRNNIIGNVINNAAAGVTMREYNAARKILKGLKSGKLDDHQLAILDSAFKHNVIHGGFLYDMAHHGGLQFNDPTTLEKVSKWLQDVKFTKKMRGAAENIDDVSRLANYMNGLNKFGKADKAAEQVRKYLFNYNEMTNGDRAMRRLIPFWNWTKRNLPLQVENLMEKPSLALGMERAREAFNSDQEGTDWQKELGWKVPFTNYYTSVPSPTDDLNTFLHPTKLASSLNPVPKMGIEYLTNHDLFTGNPISYGEDSVQAKDLPQYIAKNFGVAKNIYDFISHLGKNYDEEDGKHPKAKAAIEDIVKYFNPIYPISDSK